MSQSQKRVRNRLLAALRPKDQKLISSQLKLISLEKGQVLFEPEQEVTTVYFPADSTIASLILHLRNGATAESALIGQEGAVGGVISEGDKPAFTRAVVQIGGPAFKLPTNALDAAKKKSSSLRDHFARYGDCLLAQVLQSVACNAIHELNARLARWLLTIHDRSGENELHLTQEFIAQMLGVQRTYISGVVRSLEKTGAIRRGRGVIEISSRAKLEQQSCECYSHLKRHFERVLPGVYPGRW